MKPVVLTLALLAAASAASAQTVYRCGPDGRSYSQQPCPQARVVDVSDSRTEPQRQAALALVDRERALGDSLERERLDREAAQRPATAGKIDGRVGHPFTSTTPEATKKSSKRKQRRHSGAHPETATTFKAVSPARDSKP